MPKAPITYREAFYSTMRGGQRDYLGNFPKRDLEWNSVETELGTMVEPRPFSFVDFNKIIQIDAVDNSVSKFTEMDDGVFQNQYGTGGGTLVDFNA